MHNNYYFLRQLTRRLETVLQGCVVSECFSQNKDELIIRFETHADPFFIKANLSPAFSCLSFPSTFARARKNSVDLFPEIIGRRVDTIRQYENERSFCMRFNDHVDLLFKMHGNRSNLISFENGNSVSVFRNNIPEDVMINVNDLDRSIDWTFDAFSKHHLQAEKIYFTFGKPVWNYLRKTGYDSGSVEEKWQSIQDIVSMLENPTYRICEAGSKLAFSLLPCSQLLREFNDPLEAITFFAYRYSQQQAFTTEGAALHAYLISKLHALEGNIKRAQSRLTELDNDSNYRLRADLIMANLHAIKPGTENISLPDFYHENRLVEVKLKKELTPQKNAELLYRKAKNQQIEKEHVSRVLNAKEAEKLEMEIKLEQLSNVSDLKNLRALSGEFNEGDKEKKRDPLPYREVEFHGFKIWIGKSAQSNDVLTLKYSYKDDLWLHAKDVAGSHVLLKYQAGKNFPRDVIERAAQLAAYYSKRKNETLCPVTVTQKKYVRKRKGDPPGAVIVDREEVLMVVPEKG